jgi:hypothetical protein
MKKTHYQNIGFPKCGTSWLFGRLGNMFGITKLEKENKWQEAATTDEQFDTDLQFTGRKDKKNSRVHHASYDDYKESVATDGKLV